MARGRRLAALVAVGGLALAACGGTNDAPAGRTVSVAVQGGAAAPSPAATPTGSPGPTIGAGEGRLSVLAYRGYAEYGGSDPRLNWVGPFEKETGCRVVVLDQVRTPGELAELWPTKPYDVVSASPELAGQLISEKKVVPIDTSLVPGYDEIPKWLRTLPAYDRDGKVYGVPFLWRVNELLYDSSKAGSASWADFYRSGQAAIEDDPLSIADAALALKKSDPGLDIEDPFQLTHRQLDAAVALIAGQKGNGREYWKDPLDVIEGFAAGALRMALASPYDQDLLRRAGRPVKAVESDPGTGRADAWMVSAGAASPNCARLWLRWMSTPEVQQQAVGWTGMAPANPGACVGRARRVCDTYPMTDDAWLDKVSFAERPTGDCGGDNGECTEYTEWAARWQELVK
ncbi:spermidine/putrescine ABC transporter substrate-binding protein [Microtetraspora sp. NBRC 13810]|uniref:extracellular solute-binding protein n=1 Tax=Microtetraspora sp. NBRC 13810 TaxID=3030990 RepID=UPI00249FAB58|nr:extracellular solute-binding protein [Microtetraspora sp. NBRC 13810]GLW08401.1 spermidine/putrescine ABC transporter substrate-binding protein [Microtetraspora sp. NBRC 13810]